MNKELLSFFSLFIALFVGALYYTNNIQGPLISALNYVKSNYHYSIEFIQDNIDKHTFQTEYIDSLKKNYKNMKTII